LRCKTPIIVSIHVKIKQSTQDLNTTGAGNPSSDVYKLSSMVSSLKTKEVTVTSLDAKLVSKQQQAEAFQSVPHTYSWLIVTMYYKHLLPPLPYYEVAMLVH
jgi:hypothetical protein